MFDDADDLLLLLRGERWRGREGQALFVKPIRHSSDDLGRVLIGTTAMQRLPERSRLNVVCFQHISQFPA